MASSLQELFAQPKVSLAQLTPDLVAEELAAAAKAKAEKPLHKELSEEELKAREESTVFVGNLPLDTKVKQLIALFKSCGSVEAVRFRSVPTLESKLPKKAAVILKQVSLTLSSPIHVVFRQERHDECIRGVQGSGLGRKGPRT